MTIALNRRLLIFLLLGIVLPLVIAAGFVFVPHLGSGAFAPAAMLEPGWQFYPMPTELDPPGTVFRIDPEGRRFIVHHLDVPTTKGREFFGSRRERIETTANILAGVIGKSVDASIGQSGHKVVTLEVELEDVVREATTDKFVDEMLQPLTQVLLTPPNKVRFRSKYYVIRETRSARRIHYALSNELVMRLGPVELRVPMEALIAA